MNDRVLDFLVAIAAFSILLMLSLSLKFNKDDPIVEESYDEVECSSTHDIFSTLIKNGFEIESYGTNASDQKVSYWKTKNEFSITATSSDTLTTCIIDSGELEND